MSEVIENKVVQLQFNNKDFEKNVQESLKTLAKMKESFKMEEAAKSLKNIEKATSSIDFSALTSKIDEIGYHFTAIGRTVDHVFDNIAQKIIGTGTRVAKSMTFDQMTSGLDKYEQKIKALRTIEAATNKTTSEIEPYIQDLMKYSDDTSYSLTDMVESLGKFLNSGQDLRESTTAIKGISNAAALAGVGINEANRAMYNFAQSLSVGYVGLLDWKSIDNAQMATVEFKKRLIETAKAMGTLDKKSRVSVKGQKRMQVTVENFNTTLNKQWLTADVLMATLSDYGDVTTEIGAKAFKAAKETKTLSEVLAYLKDTLSTGWMTTYEQVIGNDTQATEMWSAVADELGTVLGEIDTFRNETLSIWNGYGGRLALLDGFKELWETLKEIGNAAKTGWERIFPADTDQKAKGLVSLVNDFRNWAVRLHEFFSPMTKDGRSNLQKITTLFEGIAKLFEGVGTVIDRILGKVTKDVGSTAAPLLDLAEIIGTFLFDLGEGLETSNFFTAFSNGLAHLFDFIVEYVPKIIAWAKETYDSISKWIVESGLAADVTNAITIISNSLQRNLPIIIDYAVKAYNFVKELLKSTDFKAIYDSVMTYLKPAIDWVSALKSVFTKALGESLDVDTSGIESPIEKLKARLAPFNQVLTWIGNQLKVLGYAILAKFPFVQTLVNKVKEFYNFVKEAVGGDIVGFLKEKFDGIVEFIKGLWESITSLNSSSGGGIIGFVQEKVGGIVDFIKETWEKFTSLDLTSGGEVIGFLKGKFDEVIEFIKGLWANITSFKIGSGTDAQNGFDVVGNVVSDVFSKFGVIGDKIVAVKDSLGAAASAIGEGLNIENIFDRIGSFIGSIIDFVKNKVDWNAIKDMAMAVVQIRLLWSAGTLISEFSKGIGSTMKALNKRIKNIGKEDTGSAFEEIGNMMLKIAASVAIIAGALFVIGSMDTKAIDNAKNALLQIGIGIAAFTFVMSKVVGKGGVEGFGKGILDTALGLIVLYGALNLYAGLNPETLKKGLIAITPLLLILGLFTRLASKNGDFSTFIQLGIGLMMLIIPLKTFADMNWEELAKGLGGLGVMLLELGVFTRIAGKMGKKSANSFIAIMGIAVALNLMIFPIKELSKMKGDQLMKGLIALGAIMLGMGAFVKIIGNVKAGSVVTSIVAIGLSLFMIVQTLKYLVDSGIDPQAVEKFSEGIAKMMISFGIGIFALSKAGFAGGIAAAASLLEFLVIMGAALAALGWVNDTFPEIRTFIESGGDLLESLGEALGKFIHGVLAGIFGANPVDKFMTDINTMGDGLKNFGDKMSDFSSSSVSEAVNALIALGGAAASIPRSGGLIQQFIGEHDVDKFATDLPKLGQGLKNFGEEVKDIDTKTVKAASDSVAVLAELSGDLPYKDDSLMGKLFGHVSFDDFGKSLRFLGLGLNSFHRTTKDIDNNAVQAAAYSAEMLVKLSTQTDWGENTLLGRIAGHEGLDTFGSSLKTFGEGIKDFHGEIKDIDADAVTAAANAASVLTSLSQKTDWSEDTIMGHIMGHEDLGYFGSTLGALGAGLKAFDAEIKGIDASSITAAANSADVLTALSKKTDWSEDTIMGHFMGHEDLGSFGNTLEALGAGLKSFDAEVKGIDPSSIAAATNSADMLVALSKKTDFSEGTLLGFLMGRESLGEFGNNLTLLGSGLKSFVQDGNQITEGESTHAINVLSAALGDLGLIKSQVKGLKDAGFTDVTRFLTTTLDAVGTGLANLELKTQTVNPIHLNLIATGLTAIGNAMRAWGSKDVRDGSKTVRTELKDMAKDDGMMQAFVKIAEAITTGVNNAIQNETQEGSMTQNAVASYFNAIEGALGSQDNYDRMYALGGYLMSGLSAGITDHAGYGSDAMSGAVGQTIDAGYTKADSHSPSKVMMALGRYMDEGLALGIDNYSGIPTNSTGNMMSGVITVAKDAANTIQYLLDHDPSMSPVITPVFDMAKVREGAGYLNGQISSLNGLRVGGINTGNIAAEIAADTGSVGIIAAINQINSHLDDLSEAILSMGISIDGKRLVGSIENDIDRQLGLRAIREERRG